VMKFRQEHGLFRPMRMKSGIWIFEIQVNEAKNRSFLIRK